MVVFKEFRLEAAHSLPRVPDGHKCHRLHGHSYLIRIEVEGVVGQCSGWVIDYADIAAAWRPIFDKLDHRNLNDIPGLENSTSEHLARWIAERLELPGLSAIEVRETPTSGVRHEL